MANFKFVKSATAAVLGASVLTTAVVVPGADASAKTTYKVNKNGTLVNAKTNKAVKGYKTYKGKLYKNGKKFTGKTSSGVYYVKGKKFTGKTKYGYYYVNGKRFTGTTKYGYYYVNGKRFNGKTKYGNLYVDGKRYTGTTKYGYTYYNGKRVEGEYKAKVYTNGKLVTGLYKDKLYTKGVLETGLDLYKDKLYKDGVLNVGYALYNNELYKDTVKNVGFIADPLKDGKAYYDALLANGTYDVEGVEKAFEDGIEVGAKVKSVEAINAKEIKVTFNKTVKKDTVIESDGSLVDSIFTFSGIDGATAVNGNTSKASLSEDGKTLTITADTAFNGKYVVSLAKDIVKTSDNQSFFEAYTSGVVNFKDEVRPTFAGVTNPTNNVATFSFSEPLNVANAAAVESALTIKDANGATVSPAGLVTLASDNKSFDLDISTFTADKNYTVTFAGLSDYAGNLITPNPITTTVVNKVVDNVAPTVEKAEAVKTGVLKITLSEKVKATSGVVGTYDIGAGAVNIDLTAVSGNATVDSTGKVITVNAVGFTGVKTVTLDGFKDLSGNTIAAPYSKVLQFAADTTAPTYVSQELKTISGSQYLIVKYSENVVVDNTAGAITGTYVDGNSVTKSVTIPNNATNVSLYDVDGDGVSDSVKIKLVDAATDALPVGAYTVSLPLGLVDDGIAANNSAVKSVNFTLGTTTDSGKPTVVDGDSDSSNGYSGIDVQSAEDTVVVNFSEPVSAATALNLNNYLVEGQPVFEKAIFDGDQKTVKLTLKANAIDVNGLRNFTIQNVADTAGNVMDAITTKATFKENVKPTITSVKLTADNKITVTFSESVAFTGTDDFTVKVNGVANVVTGVTGTGTNQAVITLTDAVTDLTLPIELTVAAGNDVVDTATPANSLSTTGTLSVSK